VSETHEVVSDQEQGMTPLDAESLLAPRNSCSDALAFELTNNLQTESLNSNEYGITSEKNKQDTAKVDVPKNSVILSRNDHIVEEKVAKDEDIIDENALIHKINKIDSEKEEHQIINDEINREIKDQQQRCFILDKISEENNHIELIHPDKVDDTMDLNKEIMELQKEDVVRSYASDVADLLKEMKEPKNVETSTYQSPGVVSLREAVS